MKLWYRFIHFEEGPGGWNCINNSETVLGRCEFYRPWRQWVFTQERESVVFSADCLRDIAHFMEQLPK